LQGFFFRSWFLQHFDLTFLGFFDFFFPELQLPEQPVWHRVSAISTSGIDELNTLSM